MNFFLYGKCDLPTGLFPYNVIVSPDGKIALTADNGNHGTSDGNAKSIGVIDLTADPVRVINHVTVEDSPEGLAISPKGTIALSIEARGSNPADLKLVLSPGWMHSATTFSFSFSLPLVGRKPRPSREGHPRARCGRTAGPSSCQSRE